MLDPSQLRLGKREALHDPRSLRLRAYMGPDLPPAPQAVDWGSARRQPPGMLLNDRLGSCTCTSLGHAEHVWTAANGKESPVTDDDILKAYMEACGYDPADPSTDQGGYMLLVLNYARKVGIAGRKIAGYAAIDLKDREALKQSIALFGGAYLGISLPESAQGREEWRVALGGTQGDPRPNSWGGHAVFANGYRDRGKPGDGILIDTWGGPLLVSWDFGDAYIDEGYALVSPSWADADGAPNGLFIDRLLADVGKVSA